MGARLGTAWRSSSFWMRKIRLTLRQGPDELFETVSQALLNAVDRDALSGWGAHVYIIEKDKVTKRLLKGRQD
jgi:20S proteasome alpha/beta subunit